MTLDLYIARRFLWLFLRVFGAFFAVMLGIGVIEELRRFSGRGITFAEAFSLALTSAPANLYQILPLVVILSAIGLFIGLARSSELVVVRGAGRSGMRFLLSPALTAFAIGAVGVTLLNPVTAATQRAYQDRVFDQTSGGSVASVSAAGLWLRQGSAAGQTVIHAQRSNLNATELFGVNFLIYDAQGGLNGRISAASARLEPGVWALSGAKEWSLTDTNPEKTAQKRDSGLSVATDLTAAKIAGSFAAPTAVSFWDLRAYVRDLESAGFSGLAHRMRFAQELASPLFLSAMVLIAAGFTMRHARAGGTGPLVLLALLCGFLIFFLRNFGQVLGENAQIPVLLAAWSPPLIAILMSAGLLLHLEDG